MFLQNMLCKERRIYFEQRLCVLPKRKVRGKKRGIVTISNIGDLLFQSFSILLLFLIYVIGLAFGRGHRLVGWLWVEDVPVILSSFLIQFFAFLCIPLSSYALSGSLSSSSSSSLSTLLIYWYFSLHKFSNSI